MIKRTVHIKSVEVFSGPCLLASAMSSVFALATSTDLIINQNKPPTGRLSLYIAEQNIFNPRHQNIPSKPLYGAKIDFKTPIIFSL